MKQLLENWRKYLTEEELLTEAAFEPEDLPEDISVVVESDDTGASIYLAKQGSGGWEGLSSGKVYGEIDINPATETRGLPAAAPGWFTILWQQVGGVRCFMI